MKIKYKKPPEGGLEVCERREQREKIYGTQFGIRERR